MVLWDPLQASPELYMARAAKGVRLASGQFSPVQIHALYTEDLHICVYVCISLVLLAGVVS